MPSDLTQIMLILTAVFALLVWGRVRYDLVAFGALVLAAALGLVPYDQVFGGFGHSAVAIIALVLIVSRGLSSSGAVELIAARLIDPERPRAMAYRGAREPWPRGCRRSSTTWRRWRS